MLFQNSALSLVWLRMTSKKDLDHIEMTVGKISYQHLHYSYVDKTGHFLRRRSKAVVSNIEFQKLLCYNTVINHVILYLYQCDLIMTFVKLRHTKIDQLIGLFK